MVLCRVRGVNKIGVADEDYYFISSKNDTSFYHKYYFYPWDCMPHPNGLDARTRWNQLVCCMQAEVRRTMADCLRRHHMIGSSHIHMTQSTAGFQPGLHLPLFPVLVFNLLQLSVAKLLEPEARLLLSILSSAMMSSCSDLARKVWLE